MKKEAALIALILLLISGCIPGQTSNIVEDTKTIQPVSIGYIGCSNTRETVEGYHHVGGKKMWDYERRYGSGTLLDWSRNLDDSKYWDVFDELLEKHPETKTIWWELCIMNEDRATSYENAEVILNEVRKRIPDAVIYVSALADYSEGICSITGTWGLEKGKELVQEIDSKNADVLPGPVLGPMSAKDTAKDGCHLSSPDGKRKLGNQMRLFFDSEDYSANQASVGYLGCSNTMQTVASYWLAGGRTLWDFKEDELHEYDGGAVIDWSKRSESGNKFWKIFDRYLENSPNTKAVWWQLCILKDEADITYEDALLVVEAVRKRIPNITIYVSPLAEYTENICEITGIEGIERAKSLAQELDSRNDDITAGPILGPLSLAEITTGEDRCHLNEEGMRKLGQQMKQFFDSSLTVEVVKKVPEILDEHQPGKEVEEIKEINENTKLDKQPVVEGKAKPVDKKKFQIFDPVLTYDGAYNGPLYGTSEQVGSASMDLYFENLDRNGINFFIGFLGISGEPAAGTLISNQGLGEVISAAQKHPYRIIPFFNPGIGGETIEEEGYLQTGLFEWYKNTLAASKNIVETDFIRGFGEVETQEWSARHNDPKIIELIEMAENNDINFMFHPVASKFGDVKKIIEAYPNTVFLIHMYREDLEKSKTELIKVLKEHDNLYFSMDAAHILFVNGNDIIYTYDSTNKESSISKFVSTFDSKEKSMITSAIQAYKPLVDAVPDKVMWGTEIGPEYAFDPKVFDRAVKISRFVIAGFNEEHQEGVGYGNALRVFGEGVSPDTNIKVIDTSSWPECKSSQMDDCDDSCKIPDGDSLTSEQEACFHNCLIQKQCKEVIEMDVG